MMVRSIVLSFVCFVVQAVRECQDDLLAQADLLIEDLSLLQLRASSSLARRTSGAFHDGSIQNVGYEGSPTFNDESSATSACVADDKCLGLSQRTSGEWRQLFKGLSSCRTWAAGVPNSSVQAVRVKAPIHPNYKDENAIANWTEAGIDAVNATRNALQKALQKGNAGAAELRDANWTAIGEEVETAGTNASDRLRASIHAYQQLLEHPAPGSMHIDWPCAGEVLVAGGVTAAAAGSTTSDLIPFVLDGLGFSEDGVVMDSAAAQIQSRIGNVKKGSIFALLQSIAMGGASKAPYVLVAAGVAAGASVEFVLHSICRPQEWFVVS